MQSLFVILVMLTLTAIVTVTMAVSVSIIRNTNNDCISYRPSYGTMQFLLLNETFVSDCR